LEKDSKIYVAGHRGLAGSAILRRLVADNYKNLTTRSRAELDLTDQNAVERFFAEEKPEYVFLAAAKVGGIMANNTYPAEFLRENLLIQTNVIHQSWKNGVKRLLFLGSSCIYPRDCPQPIREEYLFTGPLEPTNRPYAVAKIAGIEMCRAYNKEYGTGYIAAMPSNLYGPGDNYDLNNSHVLPALIRKVHEAKVRGEEKVVAWGTGSPFREFTYSDDAADACVFLMNLPDEAFFGIVATETAPALINVGTGTDNTIRELLEIVIESMGYKGTAEWDRSKPDGTPRKVMDNKRINTLGWRPKTTLREGIKKAYEDFLARHGHDSATTPPKPPPNRT
jgi:GDP-L-fucose synthase